MDWNEIKRDIQQDLKSRGLRDPGIRLRALENIEKLLRNHFPKHLENPTVMFSQTNKNRMKKSLAQYKNNQKLNSAESSIINEIYYRI